MIKFTTMPAEAISELLMYLAENENFDSLAKLDGGVTPVEARDVLKEVAVVIGRESSTTNEDAFESLLKQAGAKSKTREVISELSESDGRALLNAFDLLDK